MLAWYCNVSSIFVYMQDIGCCLHFENVSEIILVSLRFIIPFAHENVP